jgi:hypothetical protein
MRLCLHPYKTNGKITILYPVCPLREEQRLRVFGNRVVREIFGPTRDEVMEKWRSYTLGSFIICTHHQILLGRSNQGE